MNKKILLLLVVAATIPSYGFGKSGSEHKEKLKSIKKRTSIDNQISILTRILKKAPDDFYTSKKRVWLFLTRTYANVFANKIIARGKKPDFQTNEDLRKKYIELIDIFAGKDFLRAHHNDVLDMINHVFRERIQGLIDYEEEQKFFKKGEESGLVKLRSEIETELDVLPQKSDGVKTWINVLRTKTWNIFSQKVGGFYVPN